MSNFVHIGLSDGYVIRLSASGKDIRILVMSKSPYGFMDNVAKTTLSIKEFAAKMSEIVEMLE